MSSRRMLRNGIFGVLALVATSGCGPDYALYKVHITTQSQKQADRDPIDECRISATDDQNKPVITDQLLGTDYDSQNVLQHGCASTATKSFIGDFSYSTSRTSGSLTFTVNAYSTANGAKTVIMTGSGSAPVSKWPPEVLVNVVIK